MSVESSAASLSGKYGRVCKNLRSFNFPCNMNCFVAILECIAILLSGIKTEGFLVLACSVMVIFKKGEGGF